MATEYADKAALLGASDLIERDVHLPSIDMTVKVQSLGATYSNQATSEAVVLIQGPGGEQSSTIDQDKLELLQLLHGLVEPKLDSLVEARIFATNTGRAFKKVIAVIDEISGVDKEAIEAEAKKFPASGPGETGPGENGGGTGSGGPDLPVRAGRDAGDDD